MTGAAHNSICRKKTAHRLETGTLGFLGCNELQCAGTAPVFGSEEILLHPNRVNAMEVVA